jgi:hypothetical protein
VGAFVEGAHLVSPDAGGVDDGGRRDIDGGAVGLDDDC